MAKKTARMPWRTKKAIMRSHSYQSLVLRARSKRNGRARSRGVPNQLITIRSRARAGVRLRGTGRRRARVVIERRLHGITITRGGPHRKTQRMERSVRSRSAFCRHAALFRADFVHAQGYTGLALV